MKSGFAYVAAISSCALYCLNGGSDCCMSMVGPLLAIVHAMPLDKTR